MPYFFLFPPIFYPVISIIVQLLLQEFINHSFIVILKISSSYQWPKIIKLRIIIDYIKIEIASKNIF